ncbi:MAG: flippase-like domain-containing protein [Paramuribaculum sp.]|nr:flippase-like domain-containing protein [Paramuribaculum sp.]
MAELHEISSSAQQAKNKWWKPLVKYGVPLVVTLGLCYLLFTSVNLHEMMRIIRTQCDFKWIAAGLALSVVSHIIRAMRWQIQLYALKVTPPLYITVLSIFGTYAVNLIFPRLGEFWRTGYISARQKAPFSTVFGSMVCDRLSDTITVLLMLLAALILARPQIMDYLHQNPQMLDTIKGLATSPWLWVAIPVVIILLWALWKYSPDNKAVKAVKGLVAGIWQGFAVISRMQGKGKWLLYTLLLWGCYFFQLYLAFFAFPATEMVVERYGITAVFVCFVLSSISMGVPSNGGIGPYQWALIFGLSMYSAGIPELTKEYTTAFANLVLWCNTLLLIVLGIITFIAVGIDKHHSKKILKQNEP